MIDKEKYSYNRVDLNIIDVLYDNDKINISQLSKKLNEGHSVFPHISKRVKFLSEQKIIIKVFKGRSFSLSLSKKGKNCVKALRQLARYYKNGQS
jgi:predicted transcriptional regulator